MSHVTQRVNVREMLEAGAHFGHLTRFRDPSMIPYIYGSRNRIHIINLDKSLPLFKEALSFAHKLATKNGKIMFVGTKRAAQAVVAEEAKRSGMPYVNHRWRGGTLTNYKTILRSVHRMRDLEAMQLDGTLAHMTKKEGLTLMRELIKLERSLGGIKEMKGLPDALFVIDVGHERIAIEEARHLGIPVIGIVDTNSNPKGVDFPIPGNDDAARAIQFYAQTMADAINEGKQNTRSVSGKFQEEFLPFAEEGESSLKA